MIEVKEVLNGIEIRQTGIAKVGYMSYQGKPFFRSTNEDNEDTYQILDKLGEIYTLPGLATDYKLVDINGNVYLPDNATELIEYSYKIRAFRPDIDIDKVVSLGLVTATSNTVNIALDGSGVNSVLIGGTLYEKYFPSVFSFTAVTTGQKILIIYAKPDSNVFYLAQGIEAPEAVEPDYDGLFIARIIVNSLGEIIEVQDTDYKLTSSDNWRQYTIATNDSFTIDMGNSLAASFEIKVSGASAPTIGLVKQKAGKSFWDGSPFRFFNNSDKDISFTTESYTDGLFKFLTFEPFVLKAGLWVEFVLKGGILKAVKNRPSDSNYQRNKQFFVPLPATISEDWKGCMVFFTSSGTLTVPTGLSADFTFNGIVDNGVTITPAITSPMAWLGTAPAAFSGIAIFTMVRRDGTNNFQILGV